MRLLLWGTDRAAIRAGFTVGSGNGYANGDDQGIFNNRDEPNVPDWNPRPAFFYMYYFQKFFGDHLLKSTVTGDPNIVCYASSFSSGEIGLVVINKSTNNAMAGITFPISAMGNVTICTV